MRRIVETDRTYNRPFRHASRPHAGDGGGLSACTVARHSGAPQGVAWFCGSLALRRRGVPVRGPQDDRLGKAGGEDLAKKARVALDSLNKFENEHTAKLQAKTEQAILAVLDPYIEFIGDRGVALCSDKYRLAG